MAVVIIVVLIVLALVVAALVAGRSRRGHVLIKRDAAPERKEPR